jgi:hypothetical protein
MGRPRLGGWGVPLDGGVGCGRSGPDLVEARAAVNRSVVARSERDHRLPSAAAADGGVELTRSSVGPRSLGDGSARWATLGVVQQSFACEEGLFAAREGEFLRAVPATEASVLVHALPVLLWRDPPRIASRPPRRREDRSSRCATSAPSAVPGAAPELMWRRIAAPSSGLRDGIVGTYAKLTTNIESTRSLHAPRYGRR